MSLLSSSEFQLLPTQCISYEHPIKQGIPLFLWAVAYATVLSQNCVLSFSCRLFICIWPLKVSVLTLPLMSNCHLPTHICIPSGLNKCKIRSLADLMIDTISSVHFQYKISHCATIAAVHRVVTSELFSRSWRMFSS